MARRFIAYSSGADSTLLLDRYADRDRLHEHDEKIIAVCVDRHPQLDHLQLTGQRIARYVYTEWARRHGRVFTTLPLSIDAPGAESDLGIVSESPQATLWFLTLMGYIGNGDSLHLGYIKADEFWHTREKYVAAFEAICTMRGVTGAKLCFDLEWLSKDEVVSELRARRIPKAALWTCDNPNDLNGPSACGKCEKCVTLAGALKRFPKLKPSLRDTELDRLKRKLQALGASPRESIVRDSDLILPAGGDSHRPDGPWNSVAKVQASAGRLSLGPHNLVSGASARVRG